MSQRLWVKLLGAFALTIVLVVAVTVLLTRQGAATRFSHFMVADQMLTPEHLVDDLTAYYQKNGGWQGIDVAFIQVVRHASSGGMMGGMMGYAMGMFDSRLLLLDENGALLAYLGEGALDLDQAQEPEWPVRVDGRLVGILHIDGEPMSYFGGSENELLTTLTRAALIGGLLAALVAFALAIVLVRQITHPLIGLRDASRRIAQGDLTARVPVPNDDELGQLGHAFNRMAASLETQETLRRHLMADVAHELRTPLTAIQGTVEAIQDGIFPMTVDSLDPIHAETLLLGRLVEDLRTLALAEAGQLSLNVAAVDVEELLERIVAGALPTAQQADIRLTPQMHGPGLALRGDAQRIGQILSNLLSNALRHTPAGGAVEVSAQSQAGGLLFAVLDSGPGISPADLPHIFDRFYRGDPSRSRVSGGSGLGLAIARQLTAAHGGRIWVESPPPGKEQGSVFFVWLPGQ